MSCFLPCSTKQRHKSKLHMLHNHIGYLNSPSFDKLVYSVLLKGTGQEMLEILNLKPDVRTSPQDLEAHVDHMSSHPLFSMIRTWTMTMYDLTWYWRLLTRNWPDMRKLSVCEQEARITFENLFSNCALDKMSKFHLLTRSYVSQLLYFCLDMVSNSS